MWFTLVPEVTLQESPTINLQRGNFRNLHTAQADHEDILSPAWL